MNLTWHIIRKDIGRLKWLLLTWALLGGYAVAYGKLGRLGLGEIDVIGMFAVLIFIGLSFSLIAWIIQEDEVTQPCIFWRTRPIDPRRLLMAKLALIGFLTVLLPSLGIAIARPWVFGPEVVTFLFTLSLLCAAVAASVKDLGRYFLIGMLCFLIFGEFTRRMVSLGLHRLRITEVHAYSLQAIWVVAATLILVNQYRGKGRLRTVAVLTGAVILSVTLIIAWQPGR